jgi:maltokinase
MTSGRSAALARRLAPDRVSVGREREITVDRSNDCVVVDEAVFVKWLTPPVPSPHRGNVILAHLRAVGFAQMPAFLGSTSDGELVTALVFEHVVAARDGWEWFFEEVLAVADGSRDVGQTADSARRIGTLGGDLHVALATPSEVLPDPVESVAAAVERDRCRALLAEALDTVQATEHAGAHAVLHARAHQLTGVIESMPAAPTPGIMLHGDLHLGQVLRAGERLAVIDFEGNPLTVAAASAPAHRPAAVDVASLVQSVDHAVRMVQHRRPGRDAEFDALAVDLAENTLDGYRQRLREGGGSDLLDDRLLPGLRAAQELHELVYSVHRLPRWVYAPTLALRGMFPEAVREDVNDD